MKTTRKVAEHKIPNPILSEKTSWRLLNRDGSFNIRRKGYKELPLSDLYHSMLSISWPQFLVLVVLGYVSINLVFGFAYFLCGADALIGVRHDSALIHYLDCFFFSVQTVATIGYGRISPLGIIPNVLVTIEALIGMLSLALVTGLLFSRFARPTARVIFSQVAIIGPHDGIPSLYFRIANERRNQIMEAHVNVVLVKNEVTPEGEWFRRIYDLKLVRNQSPMLAVSWTVVHAIDESSPLYKMTEQSLFDSDTEVLVTLTGIDDTFSQSISTRFSYAANEILWNHRFKDMVSKKDDGKVHIDLSQIHEVHSS